MPKNLTKKTKRKLSSKRTARTSSRSRSRTFPYVIENGKPAFVLVPIDEYEQLVKDALVSDAVNQIQRGDDDFVDADDLALELAGGRLAQARKAKGMTQKQLGDKLKLPQSQISRIERNADHSTVRTLKRVAKALGVDVSTLV